MNHNGFVPNSQPMKIYLCEREKVIPEVEIPEKVKGEEKVRGNEKKKKMKEGRWIWCAGGWRARETLFSRAHLRSTR